MKQKKRVYISGPMTDPNTGKVSAENLMQQGLQEKKHKMDQIDSGLKQIQDALAKMDIEL